MVFNGKEATLDITTSRAGGGANAEILVSLSAFARAQGKSVSTRRDVYRNDIYYLGDRATDLSAQTIAYMDQKLTGKSAQ